ncbi:MAG: hypothetical protein F6K09_08385 [Merismopedia sp. SIO2A8]|nr:hypothetical protein [Symploca sp. SIO2B6]NET48729.1 hypothetical protein [Merismopedia sp. SIO2A8]
MTHDVQQWLTEIRSLQQRLAQVSQERAEAYEQVSRWHQSYQTEATQRRSDVQRLQQAIYHLADENKQLKQQLVQVQSQEARLNLNTSIDTSLSPTTSDGENEGVSPAPMEAALKQQLQDAMAECDRLTQALTREQQEHEETRKTLMNALGDTVEQLERERERHTHHSSSA